jgi:hypothetical protein
MAQSILIFDFGKNEEAAQQARHKIEGWKQAFRLGNKISLKFDRTEAESKADDKANDDEAAAPAKKGEAKKKGSAKRHKGDSEEPGNADIKILVRLDFSDHEKLSYQRWLDRIPTEEPFKSAKSESARQGEPSYSAIAERFESLD